MSPRRLLGRASQTPSACFPPSGRPVSPAVRQAAGPGDPVTSAERVRVSRARRETLCTREDARAPPSEVHPARDRPDRSSRGPPCGDSREQPRERRAPPTPGRRPRAPPRRPDFSDPERPRADVQPARFSARNRRASCGREGAGPRRGRPGGQSARTAWRGAELLDAPTRVAGALRRALPGWAGVLAADADVSFLFRVSRPPDYPAGFPLFGQ